METIGNNFAIAQDYFGLHIHRFVVVQKRLVTVCNTLPSLFTTVKIIDRIDFMTIPITFTIHTL